MNNTTYLIFDFDGTIVDSFETLIAKFNLLADRHGFRKVNQHEIHELRNLTSKQLIAHLGIPLYKIPRIIREARKHIRADIPKLTSFKNLREVLEKFHQANLKLGILTSNSEENVHAWLQKNKMEHLFEFTHIESSFFGKHRILKKIIKNYQIDITKAYYIGDETRDIDAAKKNNIHSIAVTWGFSTEQVLAEYHPNYLVRNPNELLALFEGVVGDGGEVLTKL